MIEVVFQTQPDIAFFAVYDGHGGAEASKYWSIPNYSFDCLVLNML